MSASADPLAVDPAARDGLDDRPADPAHWPRYCCAILRDSAGRYLLERRPADARDAPGLLTCFGGKRNRGEHPDRCIRRELFEELNWRIGALRIERCVRLVSADLEEIAWFYRAGAPGPAVRMRPLKGFNVEWVNADALAAADLSRWHRVAIEAELRGAPVARVEPAGDSV
jgi:8-oxo-dGTP pyrophosphatase MutT (NUDIX family)